jgi:hypothetical protein
MDVNTADILQRYAVAFAEDHERAATDFYTDDVLYRLSGQRIQEITFFDFDLRPLERLFE